MKKVLPFILGLFLAFNVMAGPVITTVIDETFSQGGTNAGATTDSLWISDSTNVTFIVNYDETEVASATGTFAVEVSADGTNWTTASFFDFGGGVTISASEQFTSDKTWIGWFDNWMQSPYLRVKFTNVFGLATDSADVEVFINRLK